MKKTLWIILAVLIITTMLIIVFTTTPKTIETNGTTIPSTIKTRDEDFEIIRYGTGYVEPIESFVLTFPTNGTIDHFAVTIGEGVSSGELIAALNIAKKQLIYEKALLNWEKLTAPTALSKINLSISQTQQKLEDAQQALELVLAGPPIEYYEKQVADAYDAYHDALARIEKLKDPGPQLFVLADDALAQIEIAEETLELAYAYVVPEEEINRAEAEVNLIQNTLLGLETLRQYSSGIPLSDISDPVISEELTNLIGTEWDLFKAQTSLDQTQLISPISGTITAIYSKQGASITSNTPIAQITSENNIQIRFFLDQSDFGYVSVEDAVRIFSESYPDQVFTGILTQIDTSLVKIDGVYKVQAWASIDQPKDLGLMNGAAVEVEVIAVQKEAVISVPIQALILNENGDYQVIVIEDGQAKYKTVTIAENDYANVIIETGLNSGEIVNINPNTFLEDES